MRRLLLISTAALALSLAVFAAWSFNGSGGHTAEAARNINCTVDSSAAPNITVTCTGTITIVTPWATKVFNFTLVVDAIDNSPQGPSLGDQITGCTLGVNNSAPHAIHVGPCP